MESGPKFGFIIIKPRITEFYTIKSILLKVILSYHLILLSINNILSLSKIIKLYKKFFNN